MCLYDVTAMYFEVGREVELRNFGYSKERRADPQIVIGLLVDRSRFPLEIGGWEGNTAETTTMDPIIKQIQGTSIAFGVVVVADVGDAVRLEPEVAARGWLADHRRLEGDDGAGTPRVAFPLAPARVSPTASSSTRSHHASRPPPPRRQ